ncbi:MAG: YceI family protein [Rubricoccaceae bacterium]|nr:YceI family protein [Rubricoccaceae bacterium]
MTPRAFSLALLVAVAGLAGWAALERFTFASGSRITVEGTSTVHDWTCTAGSFTGAFDAAVAEAALSGINGLAVTVPVGALDCNNGTMNGKLRDALGASAIRFVASTVRATPPSGGRFAVEADGQLTIRGATRAQRVQAQGQVLRDGRYRFTGSVPVTMSQFGVDPPTAMLGTLRTGDRVTVRFDVTVSR